MPTRRLPYVALLLLGAACHKSKPPESAPEPLLPMGGIVGQPLLIAPIQGMRLAPELAWTGLPATVEILTSLDAALTDTLKARVSNQQWVYSAALVRSYTSNPTYASDPHGLAVQSLRTSNLKIDTRLPEPLASQLRTMLALHEGRLVLLPVELRFEKTATGGPHAVLHLVLVDPRSSVIRWFGDVTAPDSPAFTPVFSAQIASRVANLFVAP